MIDGDDDDENNNDIDDDKNDDDDDDNEDDDNEDDDNELNSACLTNVHVCILLLRLFDVSMMHFYSILSFVWSTGVSALHDNLHAFQHSTSTKSKSK